MAYTPTHHRTILEKIMGKPMPPTSNYRMPANLLTNVPTTNLTPTGLVGASSAAGGAAGLIHSVLGMKQPSDTDIYEEQLAELLKEFGHLVTNYTMSARRGPQLKANIYKPLWLSVPNVTLLFRGTYSPIINPAIGFANDTWDTSHKSVIATSRTSNFASAFAINLFNWYGSNDYTGHLYILLVAPGVSYVDIQKQAVRRPTSMIAKYIPYLKSYFLETWNDEDEYVLESSPNIKIIYDSSVFRCETIKQFDTTVIPEFNKLIDEVLTNSTKLFGVVPTFFDKSNIKLKPYKTDLPINIKNIQFHIAAYGFDGQIGGSPSVTVISNDVTYGNSVPPAVITEGGAATGGAATGGAATAGAIPINRVRNNTRKIPARNNTRRVSGPVRLSAARVIRTSPIQPNPRLLKRVTNKNTNKMRRRNNGNDPMPPGQR